MAETLVLRLTSAGDAAEWLTVDSSGARISESRRGTLTEVAAAVTHHKVIALVPAASVLRVSTNIPLKSAAKIRQALPFALEEQIAGDVDAQHFACGKRDATDQIPVAVVAMDIMHKWVDRLTDSGIRPDAIYADSDAVAALPATITVLLEDNQVIIRDQAGATTVADPGMMQVVLEMLLDAQTAPVDADDADDENNEVPALATAPVNILIYCQATAHERYQELWERLRMRAEDLDIRILPEGPLPRLAAEIVGGSGGVNLLQGPFARKTEFGIHWQQWRIAASLGAAFLLLAFMFQGVSYWRLLQQDAALDEAAAAVLQTTFSNAGDVSDPWGELRARLGATPTSVTTSGPGFVEALEALSIAFAATPGLRMQTLSFRSGAINLQLVAPDVKALDQLRQMITGPGKFSAEIQSANPKDDAIEGRMQITANAP